MFLSVFEIFKIGIGPSSSHTMGPMIAAARFLESLRTGRLEPGARAPAAIKCSLHGSLAFTGKGHATDRAVELGLLGFSPEALDPVEADAARTELRQSKTLSPQDLPPLAFDPETDLVFDYGPPLPGHANGMVLSATDAADNLVLSETYYSIGGGFVLTERELNAAEDGGVAGDLPDVPYPFRTAEEMLEMGKRTGLSVAEMKRANELTRLSSAELDAKLDQVWQAMSDCIERGLSSEGVLPGGLQVRRRAKGIRDALEREGRRNDAPPHIVNDWISLYAMAVNEENAAGGQVVTSPTNGAAGVVPGVIRYWIDHCPQHHAASSAQDVREFLLTASAIGGLVKWNASISGAECGCQAEVGSASAMAAAGLCAVLGGTNAQIENAAEIALEHHLGMTCDPAGGLVQVPCIERNGLGAVKAVTAASLALRGDGAHFMPLDNCIEAMRQTGADMNAKYKETSLGGLAVNLPGC
ncbi:MAG: L-serine ammonia-lyase [Pseudomonadota bacterium]